MPNPKEPEKPKLGRPPIKGKKKGTRVVYLDETHVKIAKKLGDGNVSAGIRTALEQAKEDDHDHNDNA